MSGNFGTFGMPGVTGIPAPAQHRVLEQHEKSKKPAEGQFFADVGFPECESCGQVYMTGGGELWGCKTFECSECGYVWGEGIPKDSGAIAKGGVFFRFEEEIDESDTVEGKT